MLLKRKEIEPSQRFVHHELLPVAHRRLILNSIANKIEKLCQAINKNGFYWIIASRQRPKSLPWLGSFDASTVQSPKVSLIVPIYTELYQWNNWFQGRLWKSLALVFQLVSFSTMASWLFPTNGDTFSKLFSKIYFHSTRFVEVQVYKKKTTKTLF